MHVDLVMVFGKGIGFFVWVLELVLCLLCVGLYPDYQSCQFENLVFYTIFGK